MASRFAASRAAGGMSVVMMADGRHAVRVCGRRESRPAGVGVLCKRRHVVAVVTRQAAGEGDARERRLERQRRQKREQQEMPRRFHGDDYRRVQARAVALRASAQRDR